MSARPASAEVGHALAEEFEDGVWLTELAQVSDPGQVAIAVARAMNIELPAGEDPQGALVERLRSRRCLIVLDNCEHLIDAAAGLAEAVLDASEGVKLLASSQEPLGVEGERVFRLRSLREADGAALFVERATAADQSFVVPLRQADAVAAICRQLDGIPLAIEMAAARAPALGCQGVLERLDDRFQLLTGGRRTALPRQRTLLATMDWSHGLLSPRDAAAFRRLGVFAGSFSLEAGADVVADTEVDETDAIDAIASLVAKSLVVVEATDDRPRYRLLETMRTYALEKLADACETHATLRRHAQFFVGLSHRAMQDHSGNVSDDAFAARYSAEIDNIYHALDWALGPHGDLAMGIELAGASWVIAFFRTLLYEHLNWMERAYARIDEADLSLRARAILLGSRAAALGMADAARAIAAATEAVAAGEAIGDAFLIGDALSSHVLGLIWTGQAGKAEPTSRAFLALIEGMPPNRLSAKAAHFEGLRLFLCGNLAAARTYIERAVGDLRSIGAFGMANDTALSLGSVVMREDAAAAPDFFREVLTSVRASHAVSGYTTLVASQALAMLLLRRDAPGDAEEARTLWMATVRALGPGCTIYGVSPSAVLATRCGRASDGARLAGFEKAQITNTAHAPAVFDNHDYSLSVLRAALPQTELTALMAEGARMSPAEAFHLVTDIL